MLKRLPSAGIIVMAALAGLTGCATVEWCVEEVHCYADVDKALAHSNSLHSNTFTEILPLDTPLAKSAVIIIPPIEEHAEVLRRQFGARGESFVQDGAKLSDNDFVFIAELIDHRRIFSSVKVIRMNIEEEFSSQTEDFVFRAIYDSGLRTYMRAPAESKLRPLQIDQQKLFKTEYVERHRLILRAVEMFVAAHIERI